MKKIMAIISFTIFLLFGLSSPEVAARSYEINNYDVQVNIQEDGSALFTERITYYFDGAFNGVLFNLDYSKHPTPTDVSVAIEIKKKKAGNQIKDTLLVTRLDAQEMLKGNFEVLKNYEGETAELGYEICTTMGYRPISMVEYKRRAFTHPFFSTRITLDNELKYCNFDYDLFAEKPNYHYAMPLTDTILEVKYDRFLFPQLQDVLTRCNLKKCPISKFGSSRQLLENYYY